jgi:hypothetical protein
METSRIVLLLEDADEGASIVRWNDDAPNRMIEVGGKKRKRAVPLDVINQKEPAGKKYGPNGAELEQHVPGRVHAVVDEEVDTLELREQAPKAAAARPSDQHPTRSELVANCCARLCCEIDFNQRRLVNAEKPTLTVPP